MTLTLVVLAVVAALALDRVDSVVQLEHLSTIYLPYAYRPTPTFVYNKDIAEQSAYDPDKKILYTAGNELIHVIDLESPSDPRVIFYTTLLGGELTDIETCGDFVAVAFDDQQSPLDGKVYVYRGVDRPTGTMEKLHTFKVGAVPDMLKFTSDCRKIVVAIEGELRIVDNDVTDPEGAVAIISFLGDDPSSVAHVTIANFTKFNSRADEYIRRGVRWVYRGEGANITTTFSQDLEPEYVTISADETTAFITLEENNAIAEVDLVNEEIVEIHALGSKSWHGLFMDTSDRDGGVNLRSWPIYGLYQPDALKYVTIGGRGYILTANEGEEKEYNEPDFPLNWSDGQSGKYLVENDLLDPSVPAYLRDALADDTKLGRLRLSTIDGKNPVSGKIQHLHAYGGRSFSIWNEFDLSLVYDSGDEVERRVAAEFPDIFSADGQSNSDRPELIMDARSRKKGPETETLDIGEVNGKTVLFVASERPGVILIYTFPENNVTTPEFQSAHYAGNSGATWEQLYARRETRDVDPEDIRFLSHSTSPTGQPMLIVSGTTSGTVSFYNVVDQKLASSSSSKARLADAILPGLGSLDVTKYS